MGHLLMVTALPPADFSNTRTRNSTLRQQEPGAQDKAWFPEPEIELA